jgi:hypothetical protein
MDSELVTKDSIFDDQARATKRLVHAAMRAIDAEARARAVTHVPDLGDMRAFIVQHHCR